MAGDTALPARVPEGEGRQVPGTLQASWAFAPLQVDGAAPCAAFVREAPGSLFCALKVHLKSIFAASLVFLPGTVSPLLGRSWGFGSGEDITDGHSRDVAEMRDPKGCVHRKGGKARPFAQGPPLLNTQHSHWSQWELGACGKAQEESQGLKRHGESGFFYCQMWVRLARAPCG